MRLPRPLVRLSVRIAQTLPYRLPVPIGAKRRLLDLAGRLVPLPPDVERVRESLGGVPGLRLEPRGGRAERAVLHFHGGAYTTASPTTHSGFAAALARASGASVHLPDYRLAPEHPHPAAADDALAAYRGLLATGHEPQALALGGDSAGGGLALVCALRLRDAGEELPSAILLVCPWLDLTLSGESVSANAGRDIGLHLPALSWSAAAYAGSADLRAPELSPLEADLAGLPPIYLQAAAEDLLASDADRFAERARAAGVEVEYRRYEGVWHDFHLAAGEFSEADRAVGDLALALRGVRRRSRPEARRHA